ncbi:transcriptional regulator [Zobellella denitrificans]|nr:transcriptional regulator [Zobellella denitrificans]
MEFKLLMVFVDDDKTETILDTAREAGATGATIITSAKGLGLEKLIGLFGLEVYRQRNVVLILVEARRADAVLQQVVDAGKLDESLGTGIAIMVDVEKAMGLTEHVKALEKQHPLS